MKNEALILFYLLAVLWIQFLWNLYLGYREFFFIICLRGRIWTMSRQLAHLLHLPEEEITISVIYLTLFYTMEDIINIPFLIYYAIYMDCGTGSKKVNFDKIFKMAFSGYMRIIVMPFLIATWNVPRILIVRSVKTYRFVVLWLHTVLLQIIIKIAVAEFARQFALNTWKFALNEHFYKGLVNLTEKSGHQTENIHVVGKNSDAHEGAPRFRHQNKRAINNDHTSSNTSQQLHYSVPTFENCSIYKPHIKEDQPTGTFVINVTATDRDPLDRGGKITYHLITDNAGDQKFTINPDTGEITTKQMFDRDEPKREKEAYVIVRAVDNGKPPLEAICMFSVIIDDINDNAPTFDKVSYKESIQRDKKVLSEVMRISATDIDDGPNKEIAYNLSGSKEDLEYFVLNSDTGIIKLRKEIDKPVGYTFKLSASATDKAFFEPKSSIVNVEIKIVDSDKHAPTFVVEEDFSDTQVIPENFADVSRNIFTLKAESNTDEKAPIFSLVTGKIEETNSRDTFVLKTNAEKDTAYIRLSGSVQLDYEVVKEYTLTVRIENKHNLAAERTLKISLTDVNDNVPKFEKKVSSGQILEDEPKGTFVIKVQAVDGDENPEFKKITYELADNTDNFTINAETGVISSKNTFDREQKDYYNIKVIAKDGAPSAILNNGEPNSGELVFRIDIADKNDHSPEFEKSVVYAVMSEDADVNSPVIELKATDVDTASQITFSIKDGNEDDAFLIEPQTGKIKTKKKLDYEKITSYTLEVEADDGLFQATCFVKINITNVNDEYPVFDDVPSELEIEENRSNDCIVVVKAHDPDLKPDEDQRIVFSLVDSNLKDFFEIHATGCLSVKPLDRDPPKGQAQWQVSIKATDNGNDPSSVTRSNVTTITITVRDVNDNAPVLDMDPVIWKENIPAGKITKLTATDADSNENGPPFTYKLADKASEDIREKFDVKDDELYARTTFDREEKKFYDVPISITDNGIPSMTGTSYLRVIIGDENDNPMKDGTSSIFVYYLEGSNYDMVIGRVYVEDPDDWDIPDKKFEWEDFNQKPSFFFLSEETGNITVESGIAAKTYYLRFKVTENPRNNKFPKHTKTATVNVTIKTIPREAVMKSGSIRFKGITAEKFIGEPIKYKSRADILKTELARALNNSEENIDVFTVMYSPLRDGPSEEGDVELDVRFSAHGSPYYAAERINAAVIKNLDTIEKEVNAKMLMVSVDECIIEKANCESSCTNFVDISNVPANVFTNTTSFVGVYAFANASCTCDTETSGTCPSSGGIPSPEEKIESSVCKQSSISFAEPGWALYPKINACNETNIILYFQTSSSKGLIFYLGPETVEPLAASPQDFMALQLQDGNLELLVDYGSGTTKIHHYNDKVDDGELHKVEIILNPAHMQLIVDDCNKQKCLNLLTPRPPNMYLNVNGPLQIGGVYMNLVQVGIRREWQYKPITTGFIGCVHNLTVNGKLRDLTQPSDSFNFVSECPTSPAQLALGFNPKFWMIIIACLFILGTLFMAVIVHRRKVEDKYGDLDDIRENIINYEDEGGGEGDMTAFDMNVLRLHCDEPIGGKYMNGMLPTTGIDEVPDICGFLDEKKHSVDNDPETLPFDDVRHYAYEGDGNTSGSLSSLASGTDEGDLNFDYLSNFGPRFRKLADMYGEDASDEDSDYHHDHTTSESWC